MAGSEFVTFLTINKTKGANLIMSKKTVYLTHGAVIAAAYVALTYVSAVLGLASGAIQLRLSETLTILPLFTPAAVPGLYIGCLLANLLTGCALWDVVFGSLATLLGALGTYWIGRRIKWLAPVFPVLANIIIVPLVLRRVYGSPDSWIYLCVTVGIGEAAACGALGAGLYQLVKKNGIFK